LDVRNEGGSATSDFFYAVPNELSSQLVLILLDSNGALSEGKRVQDFSLNNFNTSLLHFKLPNAIEPGVTVTVTFRETFYNRFEPYPK